jgi:hypothetical protein
MYMLSSLTINAGISLNKYSTGSQYDLPLISSLWSARRIVSHGHGEIEGVGELRLGVRSARHGADNYCCHRRRREERLMRIIPEWFLCVAQGQELWALLGCKMRGQSTGSFQ